MASTKLQAVRGMNDILPEHTAVWQRLEDNLKQWAQAYGYQEIRCPLVEPTSLFKRSVGAASDIVNKEMYSFNDYSGDSLSLRPEGTASCVRALLEHNLLKPHPIQRLWYYGPMFRHERPQKGRYRQFYQWGVEAFGMADPAIDAELILMSARLWQHLGIAHKVKLQLNSLGSPHSRQQHRKALLDYFTAQKDQLDEDTLHKLQHNPLRILDSKNPKLHPLIQQAPRPLDYLDKEALEHFENLKKHLEAAQINYEINGHLVRGLDYYGLTVFEWVSDSLGAQATVCAGGRYDTLVEQLGGQPTPAAGFAVGLERLILLLDEAYIVTSRNTVQPQAYLVAVGPSALQHALVLAETLRTHLPHLRLMTHCNAGSFKQQFKQADKSGAQWALIIGDEEVEKKTVSLKYLREDKPQQSFTLEDLIHFLNTGEH